VARLRRLPEAHGSEDPAAGAGAALARPPFAAWPIAAIALGTFGLLLVTAGGYGYHRDELYFVEAGKHLAWGYDDQPPLTPLIGHLSTEVLGQSPTGLRVPSELALAACAVITGLMARELGGGRAAQVVAAASVPASGALFLGHILSTSTFDFLAWTVLLYVAVLILRRSDPRLWLVFGAVLGLALLNKWLVLLLVGSLGVGLVLGRRADLLRSRWVLFGGILALALWAPNLVWQADHDWPQRELGGQIADEDPAGTRIGFLPLQLLTASPFLVFVWIPGLVWLLRGRGGALRFRALGVGYLALLGICLVTGGKAYYALGWYPVLFAAGGLALEGWGRTARRRVLVGVAVGLAALTVAPVALPLVPERSLADSPVGELNEDVLNTVGWPPFVDAVAGVWRTLPDRERSRAVILTANYGEAGALRRFGPARGLPTAYSGHNSFTSFGRPADGSRPIVAVGFRDSAYLDRFFAGCRVMARFDNRLDLKDEEDAPIALCRDTRRPWRAIWPRLHHLDA
jgi:Dolichyl-phosphate-mannose-protein mannosyltransferase